jgi:hypothetical protein
MEPRQIRRSWSAESAVRARPNVEQDHQDLPFGPWGHTCVVGIAVGGTGRAEDSDVAADSNELSRTAAALKPWRYLILVVLVLAGVSYALGDPDPWWTSDAELLVLVGVVALGSVPVLLAAATLAVLFPTRTLVRVGADLTAGIWTGGWALTVTDLGDLIGSSTAEGPLGRGDHFRSRAHRRRMDP